MLTGTNLTHAKRHNIQIVYETIRLHGPISRAAVARKTQLTAQTITNLVRQLLDEGLLVESEPQSAGRGAPSIGLSIEPDAAFSVGLDLDDEHLTAVLVNLSGSVQQRLYRKLADPSPEEALDALAAAVEELVERHRPARGKVWGVGLGVPGPMVPSPDGSGTYVVSPRSLSGWHDVPLAEMLHERVELPVFIENNATAAAVGEHWYGAGRHLPTFFYFYLGTGLGGGLVVQGHPFGGHTGNVGEIAYLPPHPLATGTPTSAADHIGELFDLRRLARRLEDAGEPVASLEALAEHVATGSPEANAWLDEAAEQLAFMLLTVEYVLDPAATFVGGRWPEPLICELLTRAKALLAERRTPYRRTAPALHLSTAGTDAAALGVATLPLYHSFAPESRISLRQANAGEAPAGLPR